MTTVLERNIALPLDAIRAFCERNHIRRLALFGSVLREDFGLESDVDVLVEFEESAQIGYFDLARIQREFAEIVGRPVDMGTFKMISPFVRDRILTSMRVVYGK
ncbi:MAG: nucleotidyltransferase family protein [Anaerolineae bacterium]|nr:nucleotidyltransferase family protein [Anaerolineae bacterium]